MWCWNVWCWRLDALSANRTHFDFVGSWRPWRTLKGDMIIERWNAPWTFHVGLDGYMRHLPEGVRSEVSQNLPYMIRARVKTHPRSQRSDCKDGYFDDNWEPVDLVLETIAWRSYQDGLDKWRCCETLQRQPLYREDLRPWILALPLHPVDFFVLASGDFQVYHSLTKLFRMCFFCLMGGNPYRPRCHWRGIRSCSRSRMLGLSILLTCLFFLPDLLTNFKRCSRVGTASSTMTLHSASEALECVREGVWTRSVGVGVQWWRTSKVISFLSPKVSSRSS